MNCLLYFELYFVFSDLVHVTTVDIISVWWRIVVCFCRTTSARSRTSTDAGTVQFRQHQFGQQEQRQRLLRSAVHQRQHRLRSRRMRVSARGRRRRRHRCRRDRVSSGRLALARCRGSRGRDAWWRKRRFLRQRPLQLHSDRTWVLYRPSWFGSIHCTRRFRHDNGYIDGWSQIWVHIDERRT